MKRRSEIRRRHHRRVARLEHRRRRARRGRFNRTATAIGASRSRRHRMIPIGAPVGFIGALVDLIIRGGAR